VNAVLSEFDFSSSKPDIIKKFGVAVNYHKQLLAGATSFHGLS